MGSIHGGGGDEDLIQAFNTRGGGHQAFSNFHARLATALNEPGNLRRVLANCVGFGVLWALVYSLLLEIVRPMLRPIAVRFSTVPLEASLAVLGVLYSVLLGSTLSAAMTRQVV